MHSEQMTRLHSHTRAFTLIEVVVSLAVTAIILAGVFGVAGAAIDFSTASNQLRVEEMRYNQLSRLVRTSLLQMSPRARVALESGQSLTFLDAGSLFQWPGSVSNGARTVLRGRDRSLEIVQYLGDAETSSLALLTNLDRIAIEVYDFRSRQWTSSVPESAPIRPTMVRMRYQLDSDSAEREEVFRIPRYSQVNFNNRQPPESNEEPAQ